jgi:LAO/AO transport system kinase
MTPSHPPPELDVAALADGIKAGLTRAIARGITLVERGGASARCLLEQLYPAGGHARIIGFTGAPGAGKSTLVDQVALSLRRRGYRVAIIAVDPTSPFTGGAILGDRIRMAGIVEDRPYLCGVWRPAVLLAG